MSSYSHERRFSLCSCGEPVAAPVGGGHLRCDRCGSERALLRRPHQPIGDAQTDGRDNETERLAGLRSQIGATPAIPGAVAALVEDSKIAERHQAEALSTWHRASAKLLDQANDDAATTLFWLTLFLANSFARDEDQRRRRALLDGALDRLSAPEQQQTVLCLMSDGAALARDFDAAEHWLARCDPRPADLASDSVFRTSTAMLRTVRGDYEGVLEVLGATHDEVPIATSSVAFCAVLRANALEQTGASDEAIAELVTCMRLGGPYPQAVTECVDICKETYDLELCPTSYAAAEARHSSLAAIAASRDEASCLGCVLVPLGGAFAAIALYGVVQLIAGDADTGANAMIALPFAIPCLVFGLLKHRAAKRSTYLATHGLRATAKVVGVNRTGTVRGSRFNWTPQFRITLEVQLPEHPAFEAEVKHYLDPKVAARLEVVETFPVRVHPKDHSTVQIDLSTP